MGVSFRSGRHWLGRASLHPDSWLGKSWFGMGRVGISFVGMGPSARQAGTPPAEIVPLLAQQLCSAVLWEPSVRLMIKEPSKNGAGRPWPH